MRLSRKKKKKKDKRQNHWAQLLPSSLVLFLIKNSKRVFIKRNTKKNIRKYILQWNILLAKRIVLFFMQHSYFNKYLLRWAKRITLNTSSEIVAEQKELKFNIDLV